MAYFLDSSCDSSLLSGDEFDEVAKAPTEEKDKSVTRPNREKKLPSKLRDYVSTTSKEEEKLQKSTYVNYHIMGCHIHYTCSQLEYSVTIPSPIAIDVHECIITARIYSHSSVSPQNYI